MYYAPYPYPKMYDAPYQDPKTCYVPYLDREMCYTTGLMDPNLLVRTTISYK
jgi:hypothetical protein